MNNFSWKQLYRPLNAQIEMTMRCNARCVFCSIWKKDYQQELDREMSTAEVKYIIDGLDRLGITVLSFTGGEPTLRKDLDEVVSYAQRKGIVTGIATNGFKLYDMLMEGQLKDLEWVMVSLDFPDERHNIYRQIEVFDKAIKGIRAAVLLRKKVVISCVVTKETLPNMEKMCILAKNLGAMIELLPCEDIIREQKDSAHKVDGIEDFIPNLHIWAAKIRELEKKYPNLTTDSVTAKIVESGGFGLAKSILHCYAAQAYINIRYNGEIVFPCKIHPILKMKVTNIPLEKVYYSPEVKKIIKMRDSYPFCKGCRLGCAIVTSIPAKFETLYQKYFRAFFNGNLF